ncbi:MAG: type 1 glutamine amidotransferase [Geminicoccaceae bacterium]|nr:type 1 glutamine amidotransferase [Geminicoccaceae bacterium]
MAGTVKGLKVAVLATDGVEQVELTRPVQALEEAGAEVSLIGQKAGPIQAMNNDVEAADSFPVDRHLGAAEPEDFAALLMPGGTTNADRLRMDDKAVAFVRHFVDANKPIAAICHAPWTLIEAGGVRGRRLTSYPSLQTDLENAGAVWVDEDCVRDGRLVTSRKPADLDVFCAAMLDLFAGG